VLCCQGVLCALEVVKTNTLGVFCQRECLSWRVQGHYCWIKCVQALKNPNLLKDDGRMDVLVVAELSLDRIWGRFYVCKSILDWIQSLSILKPFKRKVFFKLSEKQPVVLSKQPIVLYLGVFRKVENCFWWLTSCQTKTTDWFEHSTDCLFWDHNRKLFCSLTEHYMIL